MARIIFHIDVNSAFLSWTAVEQLKNGSKVDLREIPAIIGGDQSSRHGIVLAKSSLAKSYGIQTGEPVVNAFLFGYLTSTRISAPCTVSTFFSNLRAKP